MSRALRQLAEIKVDVISGVTPAKLKSLNELGIDSVLDLLTFYPRRYVDRSNTVRLVEAQLGTEILVIGQVIKVSSIRRTKSAKTVVDAVVTDGSSKLYCTFFNQPWRQKQLEDETWIAIFGKLTSFKGKLTMVNPIVDLIGNQTGKIVALYPSSEKSNISNLMMSNFVAEVLNRSKEFLDPLNKDDLTKFGLISRTEAFNNIHFPETAKMSQAARKRLAFDELLRLQLPLMHKKRQILSSNKGYKCEISNLDRVLQFGADIPDLQGLVGEFVRALPFKLTKSQSEVIKEILSDMSKPYPMHRLVQGDVGSGKTVIAVCCMVAAIQNGYQSALMAPTEVLAEQHYLNIIDMTEGLTVEDGTKLFSKSDIKIGLLTGKLTKKSRDVLAEQIESGDIDMVIGTHALISDNLKFKNLAAVVIDEQHRFGVQQRSQLLSKSNFPDTLTMTATPIPRSAAMTVFGDLDQSVLTDMPKGRQIIETHWVKGKNDQSVWAKVLEQIEQNNRVYVVCPLIEESEKISVASVNKVVEELTDGPLKGIEVGVLHGQIPPLKRQGIFEDFVNGTFKVLISTTVIEVGVDVKDATVMVILDADRFGIAQLHQLRGRVGRSDKKSYCYLLTKSKELNEIAKTRLEALVKTNDGFELSEVDFALRGFGTLLGTRQKGRSDLKLAKLPADEKLLDLVKKYLDKLFKLDPDLNSTDIGAFLKNEVAAFYTDEDTDYLLKS